MEVGEGRRSYEAGWCAGMGLIIWVFRSVECCIALRIMDMIVT